MRVVDFQLQMSGANLNARDFIQNIDQNAPIPHPLEGGDGNGCLFQCVLDVNKVEKLKAFCERNEHTRIYTNLREYDLEENLYSPNNRVEWRFLGHSKVATVAEQKKEDDSDSCVIY